MTLTIRALIFDLDGVITDTAELHYRAWKRLAEEEGIAFTRQDNEQLRGVDRRESLNRILKGQPIDEPTAQKWMTRKNDYYRASLRDLTPADCLPGAVEFLQEARAAGLRIGLGSASKNAREVLDRLEIAGLFDAVGDGYSVVNGKPAPDLFVWVAGALGVNPAHAVVFEDAEAGITAALAGGFWTVGIGHAAVSQAHLIASDGLADLHVSGVLEQLNAAAGQMNRG
jgi:beta-phosphoglucomutase